MSLKVVKDVISVSHLIFDRTQLSDVEESFLCDSPMVIDF